MREGRPDCRHKHVVCRRFDKGFPFLLVESACPVLLGLLRVMSALAQVIPDSPMGALPFSVVGNRISTVVTAVFPSAQGSQAIASAVD